jgi:chlorobactene glucosyltransferase
MPDYLFIILLTVNLFFLGIAVYNYFTAPIVANNENEFEVNKKISVLIPARNEEKNIGACLNSIAFQTYSNIEIIVLDDNSDDSTARIVEEYSKKDSRIKLINGKSLPSGWLGKNWACAQLSKKATGDIILFIDADVCLKNNAIKFAVNIYQSKKVKMLSVFSSQIIAGFGTQLVTPMMNWVLLTFLPLKKVYSSKRNSFVAANGQFIMINKNIYEAIGGHESVKNEIVEDMELAKKVKRSGNKIITALGGKEIFCKMYDSFEESFNGFSKNYYPGFKTSAFSFVLMLILFQFIFLLPILLAIVDLKYLIIISLIILQRVFVSSISNQKIFINVIMHPLQMIMTFVVGINSILISKRKIVKWKGRML